MAQHCCPGPANMRTLLVGEMAARTVMRKWAIKWVIIKFCTQLPCERPRGKKLAGHYSVRVSCTPELLQRKTPFHKEEGRTDRQGWQTMSARGCQRILPPSATVSLSGFSKAINHSAFPHLKNANKDATVFAGHCRHIFTLNPHVVLYITNKNRKTWLTWKKHILNYKLPNTV